MLVPRPTAFADQLTAIGLDPKNLPRLRELDPKQLRQVMELFKVSLGTRCRDCHAERYSEETPRKKVAEHMWDEFVRRLTIADGSPVFCDSCHQGKVQTLVRTDKSTLAKAMADAYVAKLRRTDGQEHRCTTCHVSDEDRSILARWR